MERATSNQAIWIAFLLLAIATCLAFSSLPGAKASSSVQQQCSANADCSETECSTSGQVICIDNKCTCLELLDASVPAPEIAQSPGAGLFCWTPHEYERKLVCLDGSPFCVDRKCKCIHQKQVGQVCSTVHDCKGFHCIYDVRCVHGLCMCVDNPPVPLLSPSS